MKRNLLELDVVYSARLRLPQNARCHRAAASFLAHSGDSWFWGLGLVPVFWLGDWSWKLLAVKLVVGIGVTAAAVQTVKWLVRRKRPESEWGRLYRLTDPHSFPSGHAARMAMLAVVCGALGFKGMAWLLAVWGPLVAMARVALGVHYLSDVIAGSVLGIGLGMALVIFLL